MHHTADTSPKQCRSEPSRLAQSWPCGWCRCLPGRCITPALWGPEADHPSVVAFCACVGLTPEL